MMKPDEQMRLAIRDALAAGEMTVNQIAGKVCASNVDTLKQLRVLRRTKLVRQRRKGFWRLTEAK